MNINLVPDDKPKLGQDTGQDALRRQQEAVKLVGMCGNLIDDVRMWMIDRNFLRDMRADMNRYGSRWLVSGKQVFRLREIKDKALMKGWL